MHFAMWPSVRGVSRLFRIARTVWFIRRCLFAIFVAQFWFITFTLLGVIISCEFDCAMWKPWFILTFEQ